MKCLKYILIIFFLLISWQICLADTPVKTEIGDQLQHAGSAGGYDPSTSKLTISEIAGTAVSAFLSLLGVIFIILMIFAGYNWMTAGGDEEKITKAKSTIKRAIIGLLIVVGSYAIWWFIFLKII